MRYLVFSDIHSNFEAFDKFLGQKKLKNVDKILFLGDLVGYGPDPDKVIERIPGIAACALRARQPRQGHRRSGIVIPVQSGRRLFGRMEQVEDRAGQLPVPEETAQGAPGHRPLRHHLPRLHF